MTIRARLAAILGSAALAVTLSAAVTPPSRFAAGDAAFRARVSGARALEALKAYRETYAQNPEDTEAAWRLAMACYFVGMRVTEDSSEKLALFSEGRDAALFAVKRDPTCAPCHFWAATNMALYGQDVGVLKTLFSLKEIQAHLRATVALDPSYMSSGGFRILGLIDQKLPGILGGSNDRALEEFQRAVAGSPDEPLNYLFLSRFYLDELHDPQKALLAARKGAAIQGLTSERLESIEAKEELRQLLKKLEPPASGAKTPGSRAMPLAAAPDT